MLFALPAEVSHSVALRGIRIARGLRVSRVLGGVSVKRVAKVQPELVRRVMGLEFVHPVGLAAGFDKDAECIDGLHGLGFSFVEVGTLTPEAQEGQARPRVFRLPQQQAIINRMGFNNRGLEYGLARIKRRRGKGVLGVNIGKNSATPIEQAAEDYLAGLRACYDLADYVAVNISSPNTPELRDLQHGASLQNLLAALKKEQERLTAERGRYLPLAVKIAPDMTGAELRAVSQGIYDCGMDGIIATNTSLGRVGVKASPLVDEPGGLSGVPLTDKALWVMQQIKDQLGDKLPLIGAGGIMTATDAIKRLRAGADLLQLYSGFVYHGPGLIKEILTALAKEPTLARQAKQAKIDEQTEQPEQ